MEKVSKKGLKYPMDQGKNMEEKVFSYIEQYRMIEAGDRVIAGLSGGADSVCLLFLLWEYQKKVPFSVQAVHVNHCLLYTSRCV